MLNSCDVPSKVPDRIKTGRKVVGLGRVELPTYGLGNRRSIQLSYSPEIVERV